MNYLLFSASIFLIIQTATAIDCYQCNSSDTQGSPFQCGEWFERYDNPEIQPVSCDSVWGAKFCVKHIGRFEVLTIDCYQCESSETIECSDVMINLEDSPMKPKSCDHVFESEYCVKQVSYGGIGAIRYCSSKDLGNYCDYVKNRGDQMEYRSCIYTCDSDGCNHSISITSSFKFVALLALAAICARFF